MSVVVAKHIAIVWCFWCSEKCPDTCCARLRRYSREPGGPRKAETTKNSSNREQGTGNGTGGGG
jgi:hypothetical protein